MIGTCKVIEQVGSTRSVVVKSRHIGRGGSCVLTINEDGSYELNNHRSGSLLSVANDSLYPNKMTLLQNENYTKSQPSQIAALLEKPYLKYEEGETIPCKLVLTQGISMIDEVPSIVYYMWKYSNSSTSLSEIISDSKSTEKVLCDLFDAEPTHVSYENAHIMFFDYLSGPYHRGWSNYVRTFFDRETGATCYESGLQPTCWNKGLHLKKVLRAQYKLEQINNLATEKNMKYVTSKIISQTQKDDVEFGIAKIVKRSSCKYMVLYTKKNDTTHLKNFFLQPSPKCPLDSDYISFFPLTIEQCKSIDRDCKDAPRLLELAQSINNCNWPKKDDYLLHGLKKELDYFLAPSYYDNDYTALVECMKIRLERYDSGCHNSINKSIYQSEFMDKMNSFIKENGQSIITLRKIDVNSIDDNTITDFSVSIVSNDTYHILRKENPNIKNYSDGSKTSHDTILCEEISYENRIQGFTVAKFFSSYFSNIPSTNTLKMISLALKNSCKRDKTKHFGTMDIIGTRHSSQSTPKMNQAHPDRHSFLNYTAMNPALLTFLMAPLNLLREQVTQMSMHSGHVFKPMLSNTMREKKQKAAIKIQRFTKKYIRTNPKYLLKKQRGSTDGDTRDSKRPRKMRHPSANVSFYKIYLPIPSWGIITRYFSNCRHVDNDWMSKRYFSWLAKRDMTGNVALHSFFSKYKNYFPIQWARKQLPYLTTCCWLPMETLNDWTLAQYFVMPDLGLAYNLSSNVFRGRVHTLVGSFYGSLFGHLTSRSTYVSKDGDWVTTIPPTASFGLFAWGEYNQDKDKSD